MSRQKQRPQPKRANSPVASAEKRGQDLVDKSKTSRPPSSFFPLSRNSDWVLGCLLAVATIIAYQHVWHAGFIWDDDAHVTPPGLQSLNGLGRIWMQIGATQQYYPFVYSVFWTEHKFWGDAPLGYHLVNVALHIFSALLLVKLLRQLNIPGAWLAAALFALHPVEVESVAWVSELKNTLSGLFYFGSALAYLRFDRTRSKKYYALALGLFLLGLMSKTVIASLPGALLVIFWWKRGKIFWGRDVLPLVPFILAGLGAGLQTAWVEREFLHAQGGEFNYSMVARCLIAGRAICFYLWKLIWPVDLAFFYPAWKINPALWWQYAFPIAVLLLVGLLIWQRWRGAMAALLFFAGTLFPALGFFNVYPFRYSFVADHFQYLASIGPLTLAAVGITALSNHFRRHKPLFEGSLAALLFVLAALTWKQCDMYTSADRLWARTYQINSEGWMANNYFGLQNLEQGQADEAIARFQKALEIKPDFVDGYVNLGLALLQKKRADEAMIQFQKALEIRPGYADACNSLGAALLQKGKSDEAISYFQKALRTKPEFAEAQFNLGLAFFNEGKTDEAITHYQEALRIEPGYAVAHKNLGNTQLQKGRLQDATAHLRKALEINPDDAEAHFYFGNALRQEGKRGEAVTQFEKALEIDPGYVDADLNLGNVLLQMGMVDKAITFFQRALQLRPDYAGAQNNLGNALLKKGSYAEAIAHYELGLQIQPTDASAQNNLAWILATCPDAALRNGAKAVALAQQAESLTGGGNPVILHTLAAALAEDGQYAKAVETAQRALVLAEGQSNPSLTQQLQLELKFYQNGQPFRSAATRQ